MNPTVNSIIPNFCTSLQTTANLDLSLTPNIGYFVEPMTARKERKQLNSFDKIALTRTVWADD